MTQTWFIGVDLAWSARNLSGVALLRGNGARLEFCRAEGLHSLDAIAARIRRLPGAWCLGIDAPLVVVNQDGRRDADPGITARYARFHAGAHPTNLTILNGDVHGGDIVRRLAKHVLRIASAPATLHRSRSRWSFETYPYAGIVELAGLQRIYKYKRGRVAARRVELRAFARRLHTTFTRLRPSLMDTPELRALLQADVGGLRGRSLKRHEDQLDALLCADLAAHAWTWCAARNHAFGNAATGAMILPRWRAPGLPRLRPPGLPHGCAPWRMCTRDGAHVHIDEHG